MTIVITLDKEMFMKRTIQAAVFKAQCLQIMDEVNCTKESIIITKHRKPIVKLVPFEEEKQAIFGKMKGTMHIKGDIVESIGKDWNANLL